MPKNEDQSELDVPKIKRRRGHSADKREAEILTLDEILARYSGLWVVMRITAFDEHYWPAAGEVVGVAKSGRGASNRFRRLYDSPEDRARGPYYVFSTATLAPSTMTWREALENANRTGLPRAWGL